MTAEERALEAYPIEMEYHPTVDVNEDIREIYLEGYHQAEKDLALSWLDMLHIHRYIKDAMNLYLYEFQTTGGQQKIYEDVLRRFKEDKNRGV